MSNEFEFKEILNEGISIKKDLVEAFNNVEDEEVKKLLKEVEDVSFTGETIESPIFNIAVVGQYNAGKSTIISALTGRTDVIIDADVSTDKVTAYDWNGIRLLDTPGIQSGYSEHDEITYSAIERVDLIVYVVTNELFDDIIGKDFRNLLFNRNKSKEIMLVVNKMSQDTGVPETKIPDIEKVISPLKCTDLPIVFIDAQCYIESQNAYDDEEKNELLEVSKFDEFINELNMLVSTKGIAGRLTTPIFTLKSLAEQATAFLSAEYPEEKAILELLHRKSSIFLSSKVRLSTVMTGIIEKAVSDINRYGEEVAEKLEPGCTEDEANRLNKIAQEKAEKRCQELSDKVKVTIENELYELKRELDSLRNGVLASELVGGLNQDYNNVDYKTNNGSWEYNKSKDYSNWINKTKKIAGIADNIGQMAAKWATGTAEGAKIGSLAEASGSNAHKVIYNVGKFFGVKFKPWGAVKIARAIGNAGRVVSAVSGVLGVVAQIAEDKLNDDLRIQLRDARDEVRTSYNEVALEIQQQFNKEFKQFIDEFYNSELKVISETIDEIVDIKRGRKSNNTMLENIVRRSDIAINKIQKSFIN